MTCVAVRGWSDCTSAPPSKWFERSAGLEQAESSSKPFGGTTVRLFRDLWAASPRRAGLVAALIALGAAGQAVAAALAGPVLLYRSVTLFVVMAIALIVGVLGGVAVSLLAAGLTADWSAAVRRDLCRVAFGQDLPTLDATPVGELLDRIDGDVYQVASEVRNSGIRIAQMTAVGALSAVIAVLVWWPAGVTMLSLAVLLGVRLRRPAMAITPIRMAEEEAWSDLAAVMEESIHGQDDVRTTLARPYVLRLFAQRASVVLARGRQVWSMSARVTMVASMTTRSGIAAIVIGGAWELTRGGISGAQLTAVWLLALAFGGTVEQISRMVPELQYALGAWGRVLLLRESAQETSGGAEPTEGDLVVRHLTFGYGVADDPDDERPPALRDVTLTFARGRSYALVGRTGSGKSTLAKMLTRAVDAAAWHRLPGRHRPSRSRCRAAASLDRAGAAAHRHPGRHAGREHRAVRAGTAGPGRPGARRTRPRRLGRRAAGRHPDPARRRRPRAVRRSGAAGRVRPDPGARPARGDPRRGDRSAGSGDRGAGAARHRAPAAGPDRHRDRAPAVLGRAVRPGVMLADGRVVEAGPLRESQRFAELLANSNAAMPVAVGARVELVRRRLVESTLGLDAARGRPMRAVDMPRPPKADPPALPEPPRTRTLREIIRLATNDPRFGLVSVGLFLFLVVLGLDGAALPWMWSDLVDGVGGVFWPAIGIAARAADHGTDPVLHRPVVPGVVGPADAADQPAAGARADRAAPGQQPHAGRGHRPGRRHRARRHPGRQRGRSDRGRRHDRRDDGHLRLVRPGAVLRQHDRAVRPGRDRVRAATRTVGEATPSPPAPGSRPRWSRR